jgi:hypothetical protein
MDRYYNYDQKQFELTMIKSQPSHPNKEKQLKGERLEARLTTLAKMFESK